MRALFEDVLCASTGTDAGYYPNESVVGRLRRGSIRTGDIYNLESWRAAVVMVEVEGNRLQPPLVRTLERRAIEPDPSRNYTVATTAHAIDNLAAQNLGRASLLGRGGPLRAATIDYLREHGFPRSG